MTLIDGNRQHPVFRNNPVLLKSYVNKYVRVQMSDGSASKGTVYTVDPVSESFILKVDNDGKSQVEFLFGHAIKSVEVVKEPAGGGDIRDDGEPRGVEDEASLTARKALVKAWLEKNLVPIKEDGDSLRFEDALVIRPPYTDSDCVSSNEIILYRVQTLIRNIPEDA